ncbi:Tripartite-type tricarboxylate transporter, receptor component TctC [Variovorax sp. HW608]|uniref:Bug family tripartite tricarboxylate transporter substrate binding protein n=1 Tax=Variovorax sp. HW608 TaxID=1034889 RepID=UPI0008200488|nr:tripartite tricarboxylate transporter substrate binding protein [Variovorax sp. HW608]SCK35497.1 Tripartite-type tricarboxylate transporter, receptor component TctC [Variovorax sp. HW608]
MQRRTVLQAAGLMTVLSPAWAQEKYPSKPITFVCPYAAGGGSDQRSRQIARFISAELGVPVIVENKPGAGGNIGTDFIAKAKPDGYVIGMGNFAPLSVNEAMFPKLPFNPAKDLVPICLIEKGPLALTVRPDSPFKSVKDIIQAAKAHPGKLSFASGGLGGSHHLSGELFKSTAKISMTHIPYRSGALATTDLLGGQVDMMFEQLYSAAPNIQAGKLRALAITSTKRSPLFPEVPTMIEAGVPGFEVENWQGLIAPAGTPKAIVTLLNGVVNKALQDPEIRKQMLSQGNEVMGGTPEQFAAYVAAETAKWSKLVKAAGIKPE